jgi:hypothetical protein
MAIRVHYNGVNHDSENVTGGEVWSLENRIYQNRHPPGHQIEKPSPFHVFLVRLLNIYINMFT